MPSSSAPTGQPTGKGSSDSNNVIKNSISIGSSSKQSSFNPLWLLLLLLLLAAFSVILLYCRRRYHAQDAKERALTEVAGMNRIGGIIPEEGDLVEWGHNPSGQFALNDDFADEIGAQSNTDVNNQNKRRRSDLFVI